MNSFYYSILFLFIPVFLIGQTDQKTQYEEYITGTGKQTKFIDYKLQAPNTSSTAEVREVITEDDVRYFLRVGKYSTSTSKKYYGAFTFEEVVTILVMLNDFKQEINNDKFKVQSASYVENKYRTEDGYEVGYYVTNEGKSKWFLVVDKYSSYGMISFKEFDDLYNLFLRGKSKIDVLKKSE